VSAPALRRRDLGQSWRKIFKSSSRVPSRVDALPQHNFPRMWLWLPPRGPHLFRGLFVASQCKP